VVIHRGQAISHASFRSALFLLGIAHLRGASESVEQAIEQLFAEVIFVRGGQASASTTVDDTGQY
jgi:hypothetical protein